MKEMSFLAGSFVIASIIKYKIKNFNESYVSLKEYNFIKDELQKEFENSNINLYITDVIDTRLFKLDGVILLNKENNADICEIEEKYIRGCPLSISTILWDEDLICEKLMEQKEDELEKYKKLLNKKQNFK